MKVLQLIQKPQLRGAEIFACQLSRELIRLGVHVDVAYVFADRAELKKSFPELNFIDLGGSRTKRFWDFRAYRKLADLILSGGYDVVQANAGDTLKYCALSRFLYRWDAKLVFRNANKMSDFVRNGLHKMLNRFFIDRADYVISVSELCRQDINLLFPETSRRSATISIGSYEFSEALPVTIDVDRPLWINIGSFVAEKNHAFLIELFHEFVVRTGKGTLLLLGDGPLRAEMENKVKALSLHNRVQFLGSRTDAVNFLKSATILVMPSKIEGLPGVILEAFASRVPVVTSGVGGIGEIVLNRKTGLLVPVFSTEEYLSAINELLSDERLRNAMAENALSLFRQKYTMESISLQFNRKYHELIS
jgi:L-malate glycosyltransferase